MPTRITATCLSSVPGAEGANPVPTEFSAELFFDDGVSASFYCSFITELQQLVRISGDQGYVEWNDFVLPHFGCENHFDLVRSQFHVNACDFEMQPRAKRFHVQEYSNGHSSAQESQMFRTFGQAVLSGKIDPFWPRISLATQRVLDGCLHAAVTKTAVNLK